MSTNVTKDHPKKRTEDKVVVFRRLFTGDIGRSIRNASSASGLSYTLVRVIFHTDLNCKPCKPKSVQKLFSEVMDRTLEFTETMLELA